MTMGFWSLDSRECILRQAETLTPAINMEKGMDTTLKGPEINL